MAVKWVTSRFWTLATLAVAVLYVVFMAMVGRFPTVDEVFFKSPGREWAASGRFAAPELTGLVFLRATSPPIDEVWAVHPPGYPFLFGIFVKAFGFGPQQCIVFDAVIHAVLALLTYLLACGIGEAIPRWAGFLLALAVLPLGAFGRPDELSMCLGMASVLLLLQRSAHLAFVLISGGLLGLSAATFMGPAIMLGIVGVTQLLCRGPTVKTALARTALWGIAAVTVLCTAIAPIIVRHPRALEQFRDHAEAHVGYGHFFVRFFTGWEYEEFHRSITLACLVVMVVGLICRPRDLNSLRWARLWLGAVFALFFVAIFVPNKMYYLWFVGPWMMVAATATWREISVSGHPLLLRGAALVVLSLYAVSVSAFVRNTAIMLSLPPSQSLKSNTETLRALIPPGSHVVTDHYWWSLAEDRRVYDRYFSRVDAAQVDYLILVGDGSGDAQMLSDVPAIPPRELQERFEPIHNNVNTQPIVVLGRSIPRSAFGFGTAVLKRRHETPDLVSPSAAP